MLEAGIQMSFCRQKHYVLEVGVVNVRVHSEQPLEDNFNNVDEVFGEGHS